MPEYQKHLYMIVFPNNALVSSQLPPKEFAQHYTIGSPRHFHGKVIFAEIDVDFRDPYFPIDEFLEKTVPHEDGMPKRTKFISSYAVLEHVPFSAFKSLYLVTTNGHALELAAEPFTAESTPGRVRLYQEITPVSSFIATRLDPRSFGRYITIESRAKGAPKVCFTQIDLDVEEFIASSKKSNIISSPIPEYNPYRLLDCVLELERYPAKMTKTVSLSSILHDLSYRLLRHGFWFFAEDGSMRFYPMPTPKDLVEIHYDWWKHVE